MKASSEFSSGSAKMMSKPITLAPSAERASTRVAIFDRGHGQRPSASRLFSSMTTMTVAGEGLCAPRDTNRRS
jgi:hypothetical protein